MDLWLQNQQFLAILKHKMQKTKSTHFPLYFWANPFVKLIVKFTKENGVFEKNVFSNICSTHKNAPKKYSPILKFEKKKNMTCPITHVVEQPSFSLFLSIQTFDFDSILGSFFTFWGPNGLFLGLRKIPNTVLGSTHVLHDVVEQLSLSMLP